MSQRYGLVIDLDRCIGCHTCTIACKMENALDQGSGIRVETVGGPRHDTPNGCYPGLSMHYLPIPCMHCDNPPCVPSCPAGAIYRRQDGVVLIDQDKCDGCELCLEACPYEVLVRDAAKGRVWKCTLCADRVDQGLEPFCVLCCEMNAISFGDLESPTSHVSRVKGEKQASLLRPELGTGPAVYYCPPKAPPAQAPIATLH